MSAITDRLGIGDEIRELKLGRTLTSRDPSVAFHTIRYDFKPASVDREKAAVLDVESNNKVTVTAPNTEGSGSSETIFKGSRKPHQKECVLIIDHKTGEITLEKLNQNITVKRTRQQNPKSGDRAPKQLSSGRPNTPIDTKKLVPQMSGSQQKPNSSPLNNRQNSPNNKQRLSPNKANSNGHGMSQLHRSSPSMSQPISPSMPTLSSLSSMSANVNGNGKPSTTTSHSKIAQNKRDRDTERLKDKHKNELGLSDSSSDSSDHESSSSSSDDSSDSSDENPNEDNSARKPLNSGNVFTNSTTNNNKSKVNEISDNSSSDSESDNEFETVPESSSSHHNVVNGSAPVLLSMPKFSDISEDLRLSESGSDSED